MKCDELKPLVFSLNDWAYVDELAAEKNFENPHDHAVYKATEVDAAIAELKGKLHDVDNQWNEQCKEIAELKAENERLKKEVWEADERAIDAGATSVEKMEEMKATKRSLWLARAYRAEASKDYWYARSSHEGDERLWSIDGSAVKYIGCIKRTNFDWLKVWSEVESKCLKKAEEWR